MCQQYSRRGRKWGRSSAGKNDPSWSAVTQAQSSYRGWSQRRVMPYWWAAWKQNVFTWLAFRLALSACSSEERALLQAATGENPTQAMDQWLADRAQKRRMRDSLAVWSFSMTGQEGNCQRPETRSLTRKQTRLEGACWMEWWSMTVGSTCLKCLECWEQQRQVLSSCWTMWVAALSLLAQLQLSSGSDLSTSPNDPVTGAYMLYFFMMPWRTLQQAISFSDRARNTGGRVMIRPKSRRWLSRHSQGRNCSSLSFCSRKRVIFSLTSFSFFCLSAFWQKPAFRIWIICLYKIGYRQIYQMKEDVNESVLLEEEIDENYEPTQEDIEEYAKFLGMDPSRDQAFLYIAKEGLKSPLPYPWKPYQNKQNEIYYYNLDTKEVSHEHPCDIYYRNYFQKEKAKKTGQNQAQPTMPTFSGVASSGNALDKQNDPLLKQDQEKKVKLYKEQKEQEYQQEVQLMKQQQQSQLDKIEDSYKRQLEKLRKQFQQKKREYEDQIEQELQDIQQEDKIKQELKVYRRELEEQLQKDYEGQVEKEKERLEEELKEYKASLEKENEAKLQDLREEIKREYEKQRDELQEQQSQLEHQLKQQEFDEDKYRQELRAELLKEQERKLEQDKQEIRVQVEREGEAARLKEEERQRQKMDELRQEYEQKEREQGMEGCEDFDEEEYRERVRAQYEKKLKNVERELERKRELEKLKLVEKMKDYEQQKLEEYRLALEEEMAEMDRQFQQDKERMENELVLEKTRVEQQGLEDYLQFKRQIESQINAQTQPGTLDHHDQEIILLEERLARLEEELKSKKHYNSKLNEELSRLHDKTSVPIGHDKTSMPNGSLLLEQSHLPPESLDALTAQQARIEKELLAVNNNIDKGQQLEVVQDLLKRKLKKVKDKIELLL